MGVDERNERVGDVAGLPSELVDDDQEAKQFDLLMLRLQLGLLRHEKSREVIGRIYWVVAQELPGGAVKIPLDQGQDKQFVSSLRERQESAFELECAWFKDGALVNLNKNGRE